MAHNPKITSTSPRKCKSSAATLGVGARPVAAASVSRRSCRRRADSAKRTAKNVWTTAMRKIAVAIALKGSTWIRDRSVSKSPVDGVA
jgi:hypothetical protein